MKTGFTLVEILASLVILAIGCLAALAMQSYAFGGGAQAHGLTVAAFLAESEVERLLSLRRGELLDADFVPARVRLNSDGSNCPDGSACYTRTVDTRNHYPTRWSVGVSICVAVPGEPICDDYNPNSYDPGQAGGRHLIYDTFVTYLNFGAGD